MNSLISQDAIGQTLSAASAAQFSDRFMHQHINALAVPGAAVVIVQGDTVLHAQGYGLADLAQQRAVDSGQTLFRAGSVSKLFTATALMQLVEQCKIDLNADINRYLRQIQLDQPFDEPLTAAHLLLHSAGFDDVFLGMHVRRADELESLGQFLSHHLPSRFYPPGRLISYNDHGYTLAGLLVEDVAGVPFEQYVASQILEPLKMHNTTFVQPLPDAVAQQMATGYRYDGKAHRPYPLDYVQVNPAAGLIGPPDEMAHFMIAHLNGGTYSGVSILEPDTVAQMQAKQMAHHPELRGRGYGFSEWLENGRRAVFHDGGNPGFLSRLFLLPEEKVGFYIVLNSDQFSVKTGLHRDFTTHFLDTFFPEAAESDFAVTPVLLPTLKPFTGYYRDVQAYSHDTLQKLDSLLKQFLVSSGENALHVFGRDYVPTDSLVFKHAETESTIAFRTDQGDKVTHLFVGTGAYAKVPWYEQRPFQFGLVGWFLSTFAVGIGVALLWGGGAIGVRIALGVMSGLNLFFITGTGILLKNIDPWQFAYGVPPRLTLLLGIPLVTVALSLLFVVLLLTQPVLQGWAVGATAVFVATLIAFPLFLNYWNLLGYRFG